MMKMMMVEEKVENRKQFYKSRYGYLGKIAKTRVLVLNNNYQKDIENEKELKKNE